MVYHPNAFPRATVLVRSTSNNTDNSITTNLFSKRLTFNIYKQKN